MSMPHNKVLSVSVASAPISYEIAFGENLIEPALAFVRSKGLRPVFITTTGVQGALSEVKEDKIVLPQGESIKSRATKEKIENTLIEKGCGRDSCLIAVGGGVILDLVGFVAATYCRSISYISMPSTLIGMTDAAIGGKTGVNVNEAKNWIGAFHQPMKVFIDFTFLRTLSQKEFAYGFAETIKHSLIYDEKLFYFIKDNYRDLLLRDSTLLKEFIFRSCKIKKEIIEQDPFELQGFRRILNFGHTVGHALEALSNYTRSHGEAVLMGMQIETAIAHILGYLPTDAYDKIRSFFDRFSVGMDFPDYLPFEMMKRDKKGAYQMVMLTGIGSVAACGGEYVLAVTKETFNAGWDDVVCTH